MSALARILAVFCCTVVLTWADGDICPDGWFLSEETGTCLHVVWGGSIYWNDARDICLSMNGDLVKIINKKMNRFAYDLWLEYYGANYPYWIGLNDIAEEDNWVWNDDDKPVDWTNWATGYPISNSHLQCVQVGKTETSKWANTMCTDALHVGFICELDPGSIPAPVDCPAGWVGSTDSNTCLQMYSEVGISWQGARDACAALEEGNGQGDLVKIISDKMNADIYYSFSWVWNNWIGLNDLAESGKWVWLDETEPANIVEVFDPQFGDCGYYDYRGFWSSQTCEPRSEMYYLCEIPALDSGSSV